MQNILMVKQKQMSVIARLDVLQTEMCKFFPTWTYSGKGWTFPVWKQLSSSDQQCRLDYICNKLDEAYVLLTESRRLLSLTTLATASDTGSRMTTEAGRLWDEIDKEVAIKNRTVASGFVRRASPPSKPVRRPANFADMYMKSKHARLMKKKGIYKRWYEGCRGKNKGKPKVCKTSTKSENPEGIKTQGPGRIMYLKGDNKKS